VGAVADERRSPPAAPGVAVGAGRTSDVVNFPLSGSVTSESFVMRTFFFSPDRCEEGAEAVLPNPPVSRGPGVGVAVGLGAAASAESAAATTIERRRRRRGVVMNPRG
jgi:hypothetical protein